MNSYPTPVAIAAYGSCNTHLPAFLKGIISKTVVRGVIANNDPDCRSHNSIRIRLNILVKKPEDLNLFMTGFMKFPLQASIIYLFLCCEQIYDSPEQNANFKVGQMVGQPLKLLNDGDYSDLRNSFRSASGSRFSFLRSRWRPLLVASSETFIRPAISRELRLILR